MNVKTTYGLATQTDWSTDDLDYRVCAPQEIALFVEMCAEAKFDSLQGADAGAVNLGLDSNLKLSDAQRETIEEVGMRHGLSKDICGRFFRRVCDISKRRGSSVKNIAHFCHALQTGQ